MTTAPLADGFGARWAAEIGATSYTVLGGRELARWLEEQAGRLVAALSGEPKVLGDIAAEVGAALVEQHFTAADAVQRSVALLGAELVEALPVGDPRRDRVWPCLGGLAAGYAEALRVRTLSEQESIRRADLIARARTEQELRAMDARFRAVFTGAGVAIGIGHPDGALLEANPALAAMLGYSAAELRGRSVFSLVHPDDVADTNAQVYEALIAGGRDHVRVEKRFVRRDGGVLWGLLSISLVRGEDGAPSYVVAVGEDITDLRRLQNRLRHQALHDPLTGLPNRSLLSQRLDEAFAAADPEARIGVLFLDLDGFKKVNDTLGHDVGDALLVSVAGRLQNCVTGPGRLAVRMGGDEFVVLVEDVEGDLDTARLVELAEALRAEFATPFKVAGHLLRVSASIGIVDRLIAGTDRAELMRAADITLYWAKAEGRNRWAVFDEARSDREVARYALSSAMPGGLDRGEFFVEYQPIAALTDAAVHGVEALVRWRHPRFGVLGPDLFIGIAEETGLIEPLGRWVLEEACAQAQSWAATLADPPFVSVNLAARQAHRPSLVDEVRAVLDETGLPPDRLQLELTESAFMGSVPIPTLHALATLGIRIAIDDFGTGYSNLAYLRSLPVHALKLAGPFVAGLDQEEPSGVDATIVETLVRLAHTLGLSVTAEGVETPGQAALLRSLGCDLAQGWLYGAGMHPDEILTLLSVKGRAHTGS